jgi:hypothetical protein
MAEISSDDLAVLVKIVELYGRTAEDVGTGRLLGAFPAEQRDAVGHSVCQLSSENYIKALITGPTPGGTRAQAMAITGVTERGLRAVDAWRDDSQAAD